MPPSDVPRLSIAAIELTLNCNMRCIHCGSTAGRARRDELTLAEFRKLFGGLKKLGCREVCLLGGEPFLNPEWEAIANCVGESGMTSVFISNGFVIDRALVERIRRIEGIDRIGISIDGATSKVHDFIRRKKGSFDRAINAMFMLRDAGLETGAITTVMRENIEALPGIRDLLLNEDLSWQIQVAMLGGGRFGEGSMISPAEFYGLCEFIHETRVTYGLEALPVTGADCIGYFSRRLTEINRKPQWHGCQAGLSNVGIESDGKVKGCLSLLPVFVEDNIRRRSIEEIWKDPNLFLRNRGFHPSQLEGGCRDCPHGWECRAGCLGMAYCSTGSLYENAYCLHALEESSQVEGKGS